VKHEESSLRSFREPHSTLLELPFEIESDPSPFHSSFVEFMSLFGVG
jgi:hypothetical protein